MRKYIFFLIFLTTLLLNKSSTFANNLGGVSLSFCNITGNLVNYTIAPDTISEICYTLTNNSKENLIIKVNFVDGTYTNDKRQNRACLGEDETKNFGQYVTNYTSETTLATGESKQDKAKLSYPQGTDGRYHGCITYTVLEPTTNTTQAKTNFAILMRKAQFIDVLVGNPEKNRIGGTILADFPSEGGNLSLNPKIKISIDPSDNKYIIELHVKNTGNIEENFSITGVVSNFMTYKHTFTEQRKILKDGDLTISWKLDEIPLYDISVDIQLAHTPVIQAFSSIIPETGLIHEETHIFILNSITYITLLGIFLFIIIIIFLLRKKKKNLYYGPYPYPYPGPGPFPPQNMQPPMPQAQVPPVSPTIQ